MVVALLMAVLVVQIATLFVALHLLGRSEKRSDRAHAALLRSVGETRAADALVPSPAPAREAVHPMKAPWQVGLGGR